MSARKALSELEKLLALREADSVYHWGSLSDRRSCVLCDRSFTGRQVEVFIDPEGWSRLRCPTTGCAGTPNEWVHPGNPLVSEKAWHDWEQLLSGQNRSRKNSAAPAAGNSLSYAHTHG